MTTAHDVSPAPATAGRGLTLVSTEPDNDVLPVSWEAEQALAGAILNAENVTAAAWLALIADEDLENPRARSVIAVCRAVVQAGGNPDPVTVYGAAQRVGLVAGNDALKRFCEFAFDCYAKVPHPHTGHAYAQLVLAAAWRRRITEAGQRLAQAADEAADDTLHQLN